MKLWKYFLIIPFFVTIPFGTSAAFPIGSQFNDLEITFLPNALYVNRSIQETSEIPLWSEASLSGYPFIADPQSGILYPFTWLANLIPGVFSFNLIIGIHLLIAGLGLYLLLKQMGLDEISCVFGGLLFQAMPKLWAHFAAGHISLIFSVCWTPLLIFSALYLHQSKKNIALVLPGLVIGISILANGTWSVISTGLWLIFTLFMLFLKVQENPSHKKFRERLRVFLKGIVVIVFNILLGLGISTVQWLPTMEFVSYSTRANLSAVESLVYSLPLSNIVNLFIPGHGTFHEWVIYPGMLPLFLASLLIVQKNKNKIRAHIIFWSVVIGISFFLSFGSNILGNIKGFTEIPLLKLLRVPTRMIFLTMLGISILAAQGFNELIHKNLSLKKVFVLSWVLLCMCVIFITVFVFRVTSDLWVGYICSILGSVVILVIIVLVNSGKTHNKFAIPALVCLSCIVNLYAVNLSNLEFRKLDSDGLINPVLEFLEKQEGYFRTYSPSYSISQLAAVKAGLEMIDGINPLQLQEYSDYMVMATGVPSLGYNVTIPPFRSGTPQTDNQDYAPSAELLGKLNVKYLISDFRLSYNDLKLIKRYETKWLYENIAWQERVSLIIDDKGCTTCHQNKIQIMIHPNKILVRATGAGKLVFSEINYPGWLAYVDDEPAEILEEGGLFRSIKIPEGNHIVEMHFRPKSFYIGSGISVFSFFLFVFSLVKRRKKIGITDE